MSYHIIKNYGELATTPQREKVLQLIETGLKAADAKKIVRDSIQYKENILYVNKKKLTLTKNKKIVIVGFGKASGSMAEALEELVPIKEGIIVTPKGVETKLENKNIKILEGNHPIPSSDSFNAGREVLSFVKNLTKSHFVIFLISGGGSALLELPKIEFDDVKKTFDLLIKSGADIQEINCVRKHLSMLKGGQLAAALKTAGAALILSDVPGDDPSSIASGPTVADPTTFKIALKILDKYNIKYDVPRDVLKIIEKGVKKLLAETPKEIYNVENFIIGTNRKCLLAMRRLADKLSLKSKVLCDVKGDAKSLGVELVNLALKKPVQCIIFGGETTVTVTGKGKGGRNQELVLSVMKNIGKSITIASVGTDGIDGCTDAAGALADHNMLMRSKRLKLNIDDYLSDNNSYPFLRQAGGLIFTGPTQTNLMDIGVILSEG